MFYRGSRLAKELSKIIENTVSNLGYGLVDLELVNRGKLIRVFIDKPEGINIDDCVLVSHQIGHVLAVEMDIDYDRLEVSSPGLDRVLKSNADFVRFSGSRVQVRLRMPMNNQKKFIGVLEGVEGEILLLEVDDEIYRFEISNLDKVRLVPVL